jgi:hypothetical protein
MALAASYAFSDFEVDLLWSMAPVEFSPLRRRTGSAQLSHFAIPDGK